MKKLIKDGKVAVLYSPAFGGGWSTWEHDKEIAEDMVFDPDIAEAILNKDYEKAQLHAMNRYRNWDVSDLQVEWIDQGMEFEIEEYDGYESIHVIGQREYYKA